MSHEHLADSVLRGEAPDPNASSDFFSAIFRRKWIVVLFLVIGLGLGYLSYNKAKVVYESFAQVVVTQHAAQLPHKELREGGVDVTAQMLATQSMVLKSLEVCTRAARTHNLGALSSVQTTDLRTAALIVQDGLTVYRGGTSASTQDASVLTISFRGPNSQDCARIVDAVIESYQDLLEESSRSKSAQMVRDISDASDRLRRDVDAKEQEYSTWRKTVPLMFLRDRGSNPHASRMAMIEQERAAKMLRLAELRGNFEALEDALKNNIPVEALQMLVRRLRGAAEQGPAVNPGGLAEQQLVSLIIEEQLLIEKYGPEYPKVKHVRKQIEVLQSVFLQQNRGEDRRALTGPEFIQAFMESLRQEINALEREEQQLARDFDREKESAKIVLNFELEDERRRGEIQRAKDLLSELVTRLREMDFVKDFGGFVVNVIMKPTLGYQVAPKMATQLSIFASLLTFVGLALAYMIDMADKSFRTPDEIRQHLRTQVIGHIPVIEMQSRRRRDAVDTNNTIDQSIACFHRPRSSAAESYRAIRTALYFGTKGEDHKVIQVTSADAGDGKTTLTSNLAVSIAQSGRRVCLVDADFRRSRIHAIFGVPNSVGVSSVMAGLADLPEAIAPTAVENLWLLPCGPRPANPSELLTSQRFKELLDVLRSKFDTILIDTPPILAVTDPSAVAPRVDGVLLVMRITKHVKPSAIRAKEVLDSLGAKVLGCVVNGIEVRRGYGHDYSYRRYGSSGYGYREYDYGDYYDEQEDDVPATAAAKA